MPSHLVSCWSAAALPLEVASSLVSAMVLAAIALRMAPASVSIRPLILNLALSSRLVVVDRPRDGIGGIVHVDLLVNDSRDGLDFRAQFLLNPVKIITIVPIDQVDSQTQMTKPARTTDTMKICLSILREIEIDDNVYRLDINTTSQQIRANQISAHAVAEIVEYAVARLLVHLRMRIETRVAQLCDLLG